MNQFKEAMKVNKNKRSFYKSYEKGKNDRKIYKGSIVPEGELCTHYSLATVSCFVLNEKGEILVEERANSKKIMPGILDIVSGHIDNNETPTQAMIREYVEELHKGTQEEQEVARNEAIHNLKKLDELYLICDEKGYYVQFYMLLTKLKIITKQPEEVKNVKWIPMEAFFEIIRQGKTGIVYDKRLEIIFRQVREGYQEFVKGEEESNGIVRCSR